MIWNIECERYSIRTDVYLYNFIQKPLLTFLNRESDFVAALFCIKCIFTLECVNCVTKCVTKNVGNFKVFCKNKLSKNHKDKN